MGSVSALPGAKRPRGAEAQAGGEATGATPAGSAPSPLLQHLKAATHEAQRQHAAKLGLEAQLKETAHEFSCLENRYCELVQQHDALRQQHNDVAEELAALKQQLHPPAGSSDGDGAGGGTQGPAQSAEQKPPSQAPRGTAPMPLPPVLALEASRLLPGADPDIGYCTSDLEQAAHDFGAYLSNMVGRHAKQPYLPEAVKHIRITLLGGNRSALNGLEPCFLGHLLMHWINEEVWPDPLALLGCPLGLALGPLTHGSGEANLLSLVRSHAARRWCQVTKAVLAATGSSLGPQRAGLGGGKVQGATGPGDAGADACSCVEQAVSRLHRQLMGWLRTLPDLAAAVGSDSHTIGLLLRALHLGLFALAAHPLLHVRVSPVVAELPRGSQYPQQFDESQAERRCITLSTGRSSHNVPLGAKHVLCSLQPGVGYWAVAEGTRAGPEGQVVVREEVLTWEWVKPSGWFS